MKTLLNTLCCLILLLVATAGIAQAQAPVSKEEHQFVVAPREIALPLIVAQPASPIEFVDTQLLINVRHRYWMPSFRLRNRGTKPIRSFTVASVDNGDWGWNAESNGSFLMPGQITTLQSDKRNQIVPLTPELREKLGLTGDMKGIVVLLVADVEYGDGSSFHEDYEALGDYVDIIRTLYDDFRRPKKSLTVPRRESPLQEKSVDLPSRSTADLQGSKRNKNNYKQK